MTDRRVLDCVDRLFRDLKDQPDVPFGGVLLIMGGDWRQILPIVEGISGPGVVNYTLKRGPLWDHVEQFKLTVNQRAAGDPRYADYILKVGDGSNYIHKKKQLIAVPEQLVLRGTEKDLIQWVFPSIDDIEATKTASILTTDNRTALRINDEIVDSMSGELKKYYSVDECDTNTGLSVDPEVFAKVCPQGLPPHLLKLKVGAQVVLLRNINVAEGLCNGTRLTIQTMGKSVSLFAPCFFPSTNYPFLVDTDMQDELFWKDLLFAKTVDVSQWQKRRLPSNAVPDQTCLLLHHQQGSRPNAFSSWTANELGRICTWPSVCGNEQSQAL